MEVENKYLSDVTLLVQTDSRTDRFIINSLYVNPSIHGYHVTIQQHVRLSAVVFFLFTKRASMDESTRRLFTFP